ncbi:MAG: PepSY-associated TM helix domain-containing protein [Bacteroidota bacterium]
MKKLKGLGKRAYNVMFHTHTVAGIVISFALFVIFFAGAFAMFRHETKQWEDPDLRQPLAQESDLDALLSQADEEFQLNFGQITNLNFPTEINPAFTIYGATNDSDTTTARVALRVNPVDGRIEDWEDPKTTVADTIYFLHYFRQIPVIGLYLSGFVGLFFLFSVITGLLIHWKNLFTKFYAFVKEGKWKVIWTNAHTVLGVIGLPFQVMYAVTGAFFGLLALVLLPSVILLYEGDSTKLFAKVQPQQAIEVDENAPPAVNHLSLNELEAQIHERYPDHHISRVQLRNYGKADGVVSWQIDHENSITAPGTISMQTKDGAILPEYSVLPETKTYSNAVTDYIFKLHFGTFGGAGLRFLYFILALLTCFMIITGVLIWRTARDNNRYTYLQRLFHHRVTKWYLAICLSMLPAFALLFLTNKVIPMEWDGRAAVVNRVFFLGWLGLTLIGLRWDKYSQQNRNYLLIAGVLGMLIPFANGLATGDWFWVSINSYPWVAAIDIFWLLVGGLSLYLVFFVLKVKPTSDKPIPTLEEEPTERKVFEEPAVEKPITALVKPG